MRRFVARRGQPIKIFSDNGKHFKVVGSSLHRKWLKTTQEQTVQEFVTQKGIEWSFFTQMAPWMGGFYERLIGIVKRSLKKVLGPLLLTEPQLTTTLFEIEAIINTRPLTYNSSNIEDGSALTPAHF
ncbi:MAG: hypothetical protein GY816_19540 [Cytophagales bacterium]|nr:hypothetical protein [Cytophagales bacterium]